MNTLATFGNLGGLDGIVILFIVLLVFGAKRLPELARGLGSAVREFSKAKDEIEHEISRQPTAPPQPPQPRIEPAPEAHAQIPPAQTPTAAPVTPTPAQSTIPAAPYHQEAQPANPEAPHSAPPA